MLVDTFVSRNVYLIFRFYTLNRQNKLLVLLKAVVKLHYSGQRMCLCSP